MEKLGDSIKTGAQKSVLIVEDDFDINQMLGRFFASEGFHARSAANGQEALENLRTNNQVDFILLDLLMPVLDAVGFRAVQERTSDISHIPVIIMSADSEVDVKGLQLGLHRHIKKPIDLDMLSKVINGLYDDQARKTKPTR